MEVQRWRYLLEVDMINLDKIEDTFFRLFGWGALIGGILCIIAAFMVSGWREDAIVKTAREMPIEAINLSIIELNHMKAECERTLPREDECVALIEFVPSKGRAVVDEYISE